MHHVLLGPALTIALAAGIAVPASSQSLAATGFGASSGFGVSSGPGLTGRPLLRRGGPRFDGHHRRHGRFGDRDSVAWGYGGGYYDYGDYDANRSFDPDKWNDWWHDRPDRAFPRWMGRNQGCERLWYSGDVLTC
jgi:hypothetical protein